MDYGSAILSLVKASPGKFLEALRDLSRSDSDAVEQKMRRLEDKHRDKFSKDGEVQDSSRREFLSILGVGGLGAIVAGKALKGGRTVGEPAPLAGLKEGEEVVDSGELARLRQAAKSAEDLPKPPGPVKQQTFKHPIYQIDMGWSIRPKKPAMENLRNMAGELRGLSHLNSRALHISDRLFGIAKLARPNHSIPPSELADARILRRADMTDLVRHIKGALGDLKWLHREEGLELWDDAARDLGRHGLADNVPVMLREVERDRNRYLGEMPKTVQDIADELHEEEGGLRTLLTDRTDLLKKYVLPDPAEFENFRALPASTFLQRMKSVQPNLMRNGEKPLDRLRGAATDARRILYDLAQEMEPGIVHRKKIERVLAERGGLDIRKDELDALDDEIYEHLGGGYRDLRSVPDEWGSSR